MVDEGVVSFSVAASFLAAVPLCAIQGSWLAEWSFDLFFATWILASLAAYPFVCALLNAYFLAALPVDRERMAPAGAWGRQRSSLGRSGCCARRV